MFSILILTIGIPGSGKTRWVENYMKTHPRTHVISTDKIRKEITGFEQCINPAQNGMIHEEARKRVREILDNKEKESLGPEIIVDSTNCDIQEWIAYKNLNPSIIRAIVFERTPNEAEKNQMFRERHVPFEILQQKWEQLQKYKKYLPYVFNMIDYIPYS